MCFGEIHRWSGRGFSCSPKRMHLTIGWNIDRNIDGSSIHWPNCKQKDSTNQSVTLLRWARNVIWVKIYSNTLSLDQEPLKAHLSLVLSQAREIIVISNFCVIKFRLGCDRIEWLKAIKCWEKFQKYFVPSKTNVGQSRRSGCLAQMVVVRRHHYKYQ